MRFRLTSLTFIHGASQAKINSILNGALLGYHLALAHQPAVVAGNFVCGRSGWPSAIPHTSFGDSVAATAAGIENVVRHKVADVKTNNYHAVITKQALVGDIGVGLEALSCIWAGDGKDRHRRLLNFNKCVAGLAYDFSEDKVLGIYEALTERGQRCMDAHHS